MFIHYKRLFIINIYCTSPTRFGVTFTIMRENICALYFKPNVM